MPVLPKLQKTGDSPSRLLLKDPVAGAVGLTSESGGQDIHLCSPPFSGASVMATLTPVMSRTEQDAHVRTTQRQAPARAALPVTAETATSTRCVWKASSWARCHRSKEQSWGEGVGTKVGAVNLVWDGDQIVYLLSPGQWSRVQM